MCACNSYFIPKVVYNLLLSNKILPHFFFFKETLLWILSWLWNHHVDKMTLNSSFLHLLNSRITGLHYQTTYIWCLRPNPGLSACWARTPLRYVEFSILSSFIKIHYPSFSSAVTTSSSPLKSVFPPVYIITSSLIASLS